MHNPESSLCPLPAVASILFDVTNLARTCEFYFETLGFRHVATQREGLPFETRTLECDRFPTIAVCVRQTYRRPVIGSQPGGFIMLALRTKNVRETIERIKDRTTIITMIPPDPAAQMPKAQFLDPDGYVIELFE